MPELLRRGHALTLLVRKAGDIEPSEQVTLVETDILNGLPAAPALQADALIHLAWITTPGVYLDSDENQGWHEASVELAKRFLDQGGRRLLVAGTCAEYAWNNEPCREDFSILAPQSLYARAKLATLQSLGELSESYAAQLLWGRVFFPYGVGEAEQRLIPTALYTMLNGSVLKCSHGHQRRDFIHASDVANAFAHLLESGCPAGQYNISSGHAVSIREIVSICQEVTAASSTIEFGAIPVAENDPMEVLGINDKLVATGWAPQVGLRDGIETYARHLRSQAQAS